MDLEADKHLFWIAREGLKAPLPSAWKPCKSPEGEVYYFNFETGESVWDHPCDDYYRNMYKEEKRKLAPRKARIAQLEVAAKARRGKIQQLEQRLRTVAERIAAGCPEPEPD